MGTKYSIFKKSVKSKSLMKRVLNFMREPKLAHILVPIIYSLAQNHLIGRNLSTVCSKQLNLDYLYSVIVRSLRPFEHSQTPKDFTVKELILRSIDE